MAVLLFAAITFLFVDFSGIAPEMFSWAAKIQFLPAFFAANFAVVALLTAATIVLAAYIALLFAHWECFRISFRELQECEI